MALARRNAICRALAGARTARLTGIIPALMALAGILVPGLPPVAQERAPRDVAVKQVAGDVYFLFDFEGSNSVFLVTPDGVLVIDTRTHPREGRVNGQLKPSKQAHHGARSPNCLGSARAWL